MENPRPRHVAYKCKFPQCESVFYRSGENLKFYQCPRDDDRRNAWICEIDPRKPTKSFYVCEKHFEPSDFYNSVTKHRLLPSALPKKIGSKESALQSSQASGCTDENEVVAESVVMPEPVASTSLADEAHFEEENNERTKAFVSRSLFPSERLPCASSTDKTDYAFLSEDFGIEKRNSKPRGILATAKLSKRDVTPRKEMMYRVHRTAMSKISKLKKALCNERNEFRKLKFLHDTNKFEVIERSLNTVSKTFIKCQLENHNKGAGGKRYSIEMKRFALSMYKRSPRMYRYLQLYFELLSPRMLKRLLNSVAFDTGFNNNMLECLKSQVAKMDELDRFCTLMFDEVKLSSAFHYEKSKQMIVGYEDLGHLGRSLKNADHALALMARGVRKRWKQPIAYYFTAGTISTVGLKQILVKAVRELHSNMLSVLATVCDQGATNRASISQLCIETIEDTPSMNHFVVDHCEVNCIYDLGHLMKSTRNAMPEHVIFFEENKCAKFEYIQKVFDLDQKKTYRSLNKLKPEHFNFKNSYIKMKVSVACRQLSASVAAVIETYCSSNVGVLPAEALHTAEFVHLIDQLFDSLNGSTYGASDGKPLRCAISADSPHIQFWMDILPKIAKWKIINIKTGEDVTNHFSFIKGWQTTIRSAIAIWRKLEGAGFQYLCPRVLNQDPLENLFCCIRQHGIANNNPSCHQFVAALKTCVVNGLVTPKYVSANCEEDGESVLSDLGSLLEGDVGADEPESREVIFKRDIIENSLSLDDNQALAYMSGFILKKMNLPDCLPCQSLLYADELSPSHLLVSFKEHDDQQRLTYCSSQFMDLVHCTHQLLYSFLDKNAHLIGLEDKFKIHWHDCIDKSIFSCDVHGTDVCNEFLKVCVPFLIYKFVNERNRTSKDTAHQASLKHVKKINKFKS